MERYIKGIELGFANVEGSGLLTVGDIYDDDVYSIGIFDVSRDIVTLACNAAGEIIKAKSVTVILNPKAGRIFDRIKLCSDIVTVEVSYDDGAKETIYVPWGGDSDYENDWQKAELLEDGRLEITIKEKA